MPATHFVDKDAFCDDCFRGEPLFSQQRRRAPKTSSRDVRSSPHPGCAPSRSAAAPETRGIQTGTPRESQKVAQIGHSHPTPHEIAAYIVGPAGSAKTESAPAPPSHNPHADTAPPELFNIPRPPGPQLGDALTPREVEIIRLLTESLSTKQIAKMLGISVRGVKFHIGNALAKSGKHDRWSMMTWFSGRAPAPASPAKEELELRSFVKASLARIETDLAAVTCAIRDRVARIERDLEACSSPPTK